jgi:hypothetical protein
MRAAPVGHALIVPVIRGNGSAETAALTEERNPKTVLWYRGEAFSR